MPLSSEELGRRISAGQMAKMTPEQRRMRGRIAAAARLAKGKPDMTPARAGRIAAYERRVDPDGALTPQERSRRAEAALRADMLRLSLRSSRLRSARKQTREVRLAKARAATSLRNAAAREEREAANLRAVEQWVAESGEVAPA